MENGTGGGKREREREVGVKGVLEQTQGVTNRLMRRAEMGTIGCVPGNKRDAAGKKGVGDYGVGALTRRDILFVCSRLEGRVALFHD